MGQAELDALNSRTRSFGAQGVGGQSRCGRCGAPEGGGALRGLHVLHKTPAPTRAALSPPTTAVCQALAASGSADSSDVAAMLQARGRQGGGGWRGHALR